MISTNSQETESFLVFNMRDEDFGISVDYGIEVFQTEKLVALPRVSPVLSGIANLRGKIISVFNPAILLWGSEYLDKEQIKAGNKIILLVMVDNQELGILVHEIPQMIAIQEFKEIQADYLDKKGISNHEIVKQIGVTESNDEVIILNLKTLLKGYLIKSESIKVPTEEVDEFNMDQFTLDEESTDENEEFDYDQYTIPDE